VVLTKLAAFAATVAKRFVHLGNRNIDDLFFDPVAHKKKVSVRLFYVTVQKLNRDTHCTGQID
jgi:hypothetical protein